MQGNTFDAFSWIVLGLAAGATWLFVHRVVFRGDAISATAHWGGLGGGSSGWRVTTALASLLAALLLWPLGGAMALYGFHVQHTDAAAKLKIEREDAATKLKNEREDSATKLKNEREDSATKLKNEREDAAIKRKNEVEDRGLKPGTSSSAQAPGAPPVRKKPAAPGPSATP